jgi:hypothetical protein
VDPKYDRDDTGEHAIQSVKERAETPETSKFRNQVGASFRHLDAKLAKIDVRLAKIDERQLSRVTIAEMIQKEIAPLIKDIGRIEKLVWGGLGTFLGAIIIGIVGIALARIVK